MGVGNQKRWVGWMLAGLMIISTPVFADGAAKTPPLTTEAVVDHPEAMTVSDLPAPYAETIAALQASLAGHQEVIARVERAALALAKAGTSYDRADTALASADLALADAQAALASATEAAKEQEALLAQLKDMHALHEAYEKAEATYALVQSAEQKANDALDAADETLTSAHGLSEETSAQLAEKQAELLEMEDALEALRAKVKGPAQGEDASKLADDLKASETAYAAFADQVRQLEAEAARISGEVDQAVAAQAQADAEQRKAVEALEQASAALEQAKAALDTVQLTKEEILANEETAKAGLLKAQAVLDQAKADAEKAQAAQAEKQKLYQQAAQALEASQNEQQEADAAYAALQERWAAYADIPGAVTDQARFPAMDLVACAEAGAGIYTIHANGHELYFFKDGVLESTQKRRERDELADVTLTRGQSGQVALRFTAQDGKTRMQPLSADAQVLFTGDYAIVRVSDTVRGMVVYLGVGCGLTTVDMPPVAALADLGQEDVIRFATERLFESHGGR